MISSPLTQIAISMHYLTKMNQTYLNLIDETLSYLKALCPEADTSPSPTPRLETPQPKKIAPPPATPKQEKKPSPLPIEKKEGFFSCLGVASSSERSRHTSKHS